MSDKPWKKVEAETWVPEVGDELEGIYLGMQSEVGPNKANLYKIESNGKTVSVWGSKVLDDNMLSVKVGQELKLVYKGKVKPEKGNEYNAYEVFTRPLED